LLSPFYNFFLVLAAIHGRLKCLLWYVPNVAPNHTLLHKTRPKSLERVSIESSLLRQATSGASSPASITALSLLTDRTDTFELFNRDGSSTVTRYFPELIDSDSGKGHTRLDNSSKEEGAIELATVSSKQVTHDQSVVNK